MSRRSARSQVQTTGEADIRDNHEDEREDLPPQKKRRKVTTKNTATANDDKVKRIRGRRGILSSLRELPLDLVAEIFGHLSPTDLLNLARTSKEIRGILMSKSSAFIWRESRGQVDGLPDLPPDLCEPQYANLCFSTHCHKCLKFPVSTVVWSSRQRLCKKCLKISFSNDIYALRRLELEESEILTIVPSHLGPGRTRYHNARILFSREVAQELVKECAGFIKDFEIDRSNPTYLEWFEKRSQHMKVINQHAQLCATWADERSNERKDQLDDSRRLRQEAIVDRLTALGWGAEIPFHIKQLNDHKLFKQPKELTERIWKNIETPLVEFLADLEQKRLASLRVKLIKERRLMAAKAYTEFVNSSPREDILPPKVDMLSTEPFRAIIEDAPIYPEQKITEESFATALLSVPQFASSWKRRKDERLVEIMRKCNPEFTTEHLCLAKTFFGCSEYSTAEPISYPRILMHDMATYRSRWAYATSNRESYSLQGTLKEEAWNADRTVRFHEEAERKAQLVIQACGLDPDFTTRAELEERNPALECLNCTNNSGRLFMRWDAAVHHNCARPPGEALPPPSWKCLTVDEERLLAAKEREVFAAKKDAYVPANNSDVYCCKACGNRRKMTCSQLQRHLEVEHNILDEVKFEHFEYHPDATIYSRYPQAVRMKLLTDEERVEEDE